MGKYLNALSGKIYPVYEPAIPAKLSQKGFGGFAGIEEGDIYPQKYKIEALTHCLHGRKCKNLESLPPARPLCRISGEPVFDLKECPAGLWRAWRDGAVTEYVLMPEQSFTQKRTKKR